MYRNASRYLLAFQERAIAIGSSEYYPYAYISAPENYCEGLTEDGCELMWQDVETIEGDSQPGNHSRLFVRFGCQKRTNHRGPKPAVVRCYSNSDRFLRRSEITLCAISDRQRNVTS
jgi:hypothetical protein